MVATKAERAAAQAAKSSAKPVKATERPTTSRSGTATLPGNNGRDETAKLPGDNGRSESAPGLKKELGKVKRPLEGEAVPGKSATAKLRPKPDAKPLRKQPVQAKVAKKKPRKLAPLDRGRAPSK